MKYEKPEVVDFGSIAEHTYTGHHWWSWLKSNCFNGGSGYVHPAREF